MICGECNCGAVAFRIDAQPSEIFICHCSICRRFTGANGIAVILSGNDDFHWLRGRNQIAHWKKPGADWECCFCRVCGSSLPGRNDELHTFVPVGLVTQGGDGLKVAHHLWVGSKAAWDQIGDDGKTHAEGFRP